MRRSWWLVSLALLAACGERSAKEAEQTFGVDEPAPPASDGTAKSGSDPLAVIVPKIAYVFNYSFRLPAERVAAAQAAHVALCDRMGPARCQVLGLTARTGETGTASAELKLRVASNEARRFGAAMAAEVGKAGGRTLDQSIESEDVSKQMVDAQARIGQRQLLVQRLTEILRTRTGKVGELVEAERSVATAQEELDAARGWLAELRGRVAYSTITVGYSSVAAASGERAFGSLGEDVSGSLADFLAGIRGLLSILIYLAPWALLLGLPAWLLWRRRRARRPAVPPDAA